jgi:large subunit ribosomal protein L25
MELTVECQKRAPGSKAGALRREGRMPAVLYGHQGAESVSLTLDAKDAETLVRKASLNNTLIQVKVPDLPWSGKALLREVQTHPWRRSIYHLSFFSIGSQSSVEVTVPINFIGEAVGVKTGGGALDTVLTELQVQCDPEAIPETIEVDVTNFQVGDSIHVHELKLPKGVVAVGEPDRVVVSVLGGRVAAGEGDDADGASSASE